MAAALVGAVRITRGNLTFDTVTGNLRALRTGHLSPAPAIVLETLMLASGMVSRNVLMGAIWHGRPDGPDEGTLDVYVCRLRPVLAEVGAEVRIKNHWARGYSLEPPGTPVAVCQVPAALWREAIALARLHHQDGLADRLENVEG